MLATATSAVVSYSPNRARQCAKQRRYNIIVNIEEANPRTTLEDAKKKTATTMRTTTFWGGRRAISLQSVLACSLAICGQNESKYGGKDFARFVLMTTHGNTVSISVFFEKLRNSVVNIHKVLTEEMSVCCFWRFKRRNRIFAL